MKKLRQLTSREVVFVGGETPTTYQHTGGLTVLDAHGRSDFGYETFRAHLEQRLDRIPHFRWRLHEVPLGLDLPYWVEDERFSYDHHIRRIAIPAPADRESLASLVAYLYSRHLDRRRPLWEVWFIEGLGDQQYGLFTKLHHCMMDGEGANQLGLVITDFEPDAPARPLDPAIADARPGEVPEPWRETLNAAVQLSGLPLRAGREALGFAWQQLSGWRPFAGGVADGREAPVASFNAEIGRERGLVFGSLSLSDVKTVKGHFDVTVNDVVLALVAASIRSYMLGRGEVLDAPLRTSIAISLRDEGDDTFANKLTMATVTLATDIADPVERLRAIAAESRVAKERARAGESRSFLDFVSILPPALFNGIMSLTPATAVPRMTGLNLLVSNVRGSPLPMYVGGARTVANYPMSIITPGNAINVTCLSYMDSLDFGITIDPEAVPDAWRIVDGLQDALDEYRKRVPRAAPGRAVESTRAAGYASAAPDEGSDEGSAGGGGKESPDRA